MSIDYLIIFKLEKNISIVWIINQGEIIKFNIGRLDCYHLLVRLVQIKNMHVIKETSVKATKHNKSTTNYKS